MIFYCVILLLLSWPQANCSDLKNEEIFDQLATASENVARVVKQSNADSNRSEEPSSVSSSVHSTVHYENSNGFVPMIPSVSSSYDDTDMSSSSDVSDLNEKDLNLFEESNATNAEGRTNEFELLKVNNDTPAVANYQDFYENLPSTDSESDASSSLGYVSNDKKKRIENYNVHNYGRQSTSSRDEDPYAHYYSYNNAQDMKKTNYEREKVNGNYRGLQDIANYNDQSATRQNAGSSSSITNYEVNELTHSETYDNAAEPSRTHPRFFKPVVVAEPNSYKTKFSSQLQNSNSNTDYKNLRNLEPTGTSESAETSSQYETYNDNSRQRSYHRTEDSKSSDESSDYSEYIERPRTKVKSRRRPSYSDSARNLPKEHRGTSASDNSSEEEKVQKHSSSKMKSSRYRVKTNPWINDPVTNHQIDSIEDIRHDNRNSYTHTSSKAHHGSRPKTVNTWSQISPTLEISHSNGIVLDQLEKPKFSVVPVKVNLVPLANFDHATALDNSQGFDMSNAILHNFVTAAPIGAFSTAAPLLNSHHQSILAQNLALSKNLAVSTPVPPDVIVGQNTFQNPVHTVLVSQPSEQNKVGDSLRAGYLPSTVTPVFAFTPSLTQALHNVRVQNNVTPRTTFAVTPGSTSVVQQMPINQMQSGVQQLIVPQPTIQTFPNYLQTPLQTNSEYQIQLNSHGLQGQNLINHGNLQVQSLPTSTLMSGQTMPESRANLMSHESQNKENVYSDSSANFVTSATMTVGQNEQKHPTNVNSYYIQNQNSQQVMKPQENHMYQMIKDVDMTPKTNTYVQATQMIPTMLQPSAALNSMAMNTHQQQLLANQQPQQYDAMQQLQIQMNKQLMKNSRLPSVQTADNMASHSNTVNNLNLLGISSGNAHLPDIGTRNVEIVNPNIKPSSIDTTNAFKAINYPMTTLTTPIPIFSTMSSVTPQTVTLHNYIDSLTETGAKNKQPSAAELKPSQNLERPMFNPINFVPNVDIIKNQNALNNKPASEPVQQGLNLVPVMPGGNFFKPSYTAQNELITKPKLASDLQKYAEEMFKESLKTMYNSQKWNNDRRPQENGQNNSETNDLAKLRLELQKLRTSLTESKYKDVLEAHQSETKMHATDPPKSLNDKKKDPLLSTIEHLLKTRPAGPIHIFHGIDRPSRKPKPGDSSFDFHDDFGSNRHVKEFLSPPRPNSFRTKSPFHEKPIKKRPRSSRYKNGLRKPTRPPPHRLETSASNVDVHLDGSHYQRPSFDHDNFNFDSKHQSFDSYPTFTTSMPEVLNDVLKELKTSNKKDYDINHPRIHNLLGLLMKNKQLPNRSPQNYFRDKDQVRQFFENEKRQMQQHYYDEALRDYFNRSEAALQSDSFSNRKVYSGNNAA
ncbi:uncharacterized protein LOC109854221 isoform X2 [Pseudomyrmex gracilis]|uniref:uncharacterized protein LOC109854221 isoform X2 n=1 Tax=Pseudomyrmex gracilis TaxID=219809 RepID=UPI00099553DF|nr:uncharacterized protein LOC109854221 isoform X2 [Pseudomyrmex gracilis]